MKKPNAKQLMKDFKKDFYYEHKVELDFRTHAYLKNNYGLAPVFDYELAKKVVIFAYDWAHQYIADNKLNYLDFGGWKYNLSMSCDNLRTFSLKGFLMGIFCDIEDHYTAIPPVTVSSFDYNYHFSENCGDYVRHVVDVYNEVELKGVRFSAVYQTGISLIAGDYSKPDPELELSMDGGSSRVLVVVDKMVESDFNDDDRIHYYLKECDHEYIKTVGDLWALYAALSNNEISANNYLESQDIEPKFLKKEAV